MPDQSPYRPLPPPVAGLPLVGGFEILSLWPDIGGDWYAPGAKVDRVCRILGEQMVAVDAAHAASRPDGLPLIGGFEILARWPDKGGDDN